MAAFGSDALMLMSPLCCHYQTLGTHTVKVRVDNAVEQEYAAAQAAGEEASVEAVEETEEATAGKTKKQEVKVTIVVSRR